MSDWAAGYVSEIEYTYGYYQELNPLAARLAFLNSGLQAPACQTACELGFGQGLAVNIHAAASDTQWYGTDFNPSQVVFAKTLSEASGARSHLFDDAFADFVHRSDLPDFDYIALHGIWSWVSDDNRKVIVDFIRRKLKAGGVLYISYNTLPGMASAALVRHLLMEHGNTMVPPGLSIQKRIDTGLEFVEKMVAHNAAFALDHPQVADRLKKMKAQDRRYLAHEYYNSDWEPMYFSSMGRWLEPARLSYASSAHYLDHISDLSLTAEQKTLLSEIPDSQLRETVRDFIMYRQFRKDYWVKGPRRLNALEQAEMLRQQKIILTTPREDVSLNIESRFGKADLATNIYVPILDYLADHKTRTFGQVEVAIKSHGIAFTQLFQAILLLAGFGHVVAAQEEQAIARVRRQTERLNAFLLHKARASKDINYLASPVTGGGVGVGRFEQLFLLAQVQGKKTPDDWGDFAWQILSALKEKILKGEQPLDTPEENLEELKRQAKSFADKRLPLLKALQVI